MRPGAGAFAPPAPEVQPKQAVAGPQAAPDPAAFLEQLKGMGLLPGTSAPAPGPAAPPPQMAKPPASADPLAQLARMAPPPQPTPPPTTRPTKRKFAPGVPGAPKSGMTAHQMLRDPQIVEQLLQRVQAWEVENPGRKMMGSHLHSALDGGVSQAQARTLLRKIRSMQGDAGPDPDARMNAAALRAIG